MKRIKHLKEYIFLSAAIGLGSILRLFGACRFDLWFDELMTERYSSCIISKLVSLSSAPAPVVLFKMMKGDSHSFLYYSLVYLFSKITPEAACLRGISVIFSIATLLVFYRLARIFFSRRVSIIAVLIMSLSPLHIWYAQEARSYSMASFGLVLTSYFYFRAIRKERLLYWIYFTASGFITLLLSYHSFLLFCVLLFLSFLHRDKRALLRTLLSLSAIALLASPFLLILKSQLKLVSGGFWLYKPTLKSLLLTLSVFNFGYSAVPFLQWAGNLLLWGLFIFGFFQFYRVRGRDSVYILCLAVLPIILCYLVSMVVPIYAHRYLLAFSSFYYLLLAYGIVSCVSPYLKGVVTLFCLALFTLSLFIGYHGKVVPYYSKGNDGTFYVGVHPRKKYLHLLSFMNKQRNSSDIIAATDIQSMNIVRNFFTRELNVEELNLSRKKGMINFLFFPAAIGSYDRKSLSVTGAVREELLKSDNILFLSFLPDGRTKLRDFKEEIDGLPGCRLWLVSCSWDKNGVLMTSNSRRVRDYMQRNFIKSAEMSSEGVYIELFELNADKELIR